MVQPIEGFGLREGRCGAEGGRDSLVTCAATSPPALPPPLAISAPSLPPGWEEHVDDASGAPYWHNPTTGETTWEQPC